MHRRYHLAAVGQPAGGVSRGLQIVHQQLAQLGFVFNNHDLQRLILGFHHGALFIIGVANSTVIRTPPKGECAAKIWPLWASTMF